MDLQSEFEEILKSVEKGEINDLENRCKELLGKMNMPPSFANRKEKFDWYFQQGYLLDRMNENEYSKEAEECLSKAMKLDPSRMDVWNSLGHVLWKKKGYETARSCYEHVINHDRKNKIALRELSVVLRQEPSVDQTNRMSNLSKSLQYAEEAVRADVNDGISWYLLGNAHLTNYIQQTLNMEDLHKALRAYHQAEKTSQAEHNPDLHYNCATAEKYLQNYEKALLSYQKAYKLDNSFIEAKQEAQYLSKMLIDIHQNIHNHCNIPKRQFAKLLKSIPKKINHPYDQQKFHPISLDPSQLSSGLLEGRVIQIKLVQLISSSTDVPCVWMASDCDGNFAVLSTYHLSASALKQDALITIFDPFLSELRFRIDNQQIKFWNIVLKSTFSVRINGKIIDETNVHTPNISYSRS